MYSSLLELVRRESIRGSYNGLIGRWTLTLNWISAQSTKKAVDGGRRVSTRGREILFPCEINFLAKDGNFSGSSDAEFDVRWSAIKNFDFDVVADQERFALATADYEHRGSGAGVIGLITEPVIEPSAN
jgi:hypothetical protein